jgi:dienelactone hydrolase
MKRATTLALAVLFALPSIAALQTFPTEKGRVIAKVVCTENPAQSYALYLPTSYSADKPSAIIYVFDPAAKGAVAVEAIRPAAEKYGYIVAGSNNSRNGPLGGGAEAVNAVFQDTHQHYAIDDRRIYTAGFSGGARLATQLALFCKTCIAGVIANGAGFPVNVSPTKKFGFAYFLAIGNADFNFPEMAALRHQFEEIHADYRIRVFDGTHEWAPPEVWNDALRWMDVQAMRSGAVAKDVKQIEQIFQEELEEARLLESKSDTLEAERDYESMVRDFDGLADITPVKARVAELKGSKAFKAAEKQERLDLDRQARLSDKASAQMQEISTDNIDLAEYAEIKRTIANLKDDVAKASNPQDTNILVTRRALGGLVVQAYEAGERCMETKKYVSALAYFDLVAVGAKSPGGARFERARAYAAQGDTKKFLAELRQAQAAGFHQAEALDAAEFNPYRQLAEFQSLASEWSKSSHP